MLVVIVYCRGVSVPPRVGKHRYSRDPPPPPLHHVSVPKTLVDIEKYSTHHLFGVTEVRGCQHHVGFATLFNASTKTWWRQ